MELRNTTADKLLGRGLPVQIGSYGVDTLLASNSSYADYAAHHQTLGHALLFRHERWPSAQRDRFTARVMDRETQLQALEALRRSRRLQAELQHPRILPVLDFFQHKGEWFSVFPRITEAHSLDDIITSIQNDDRPPYSITEFVSLSAGLTDGLAAIHRSGFVHRTLGTNNIHLDGSGYVRLADLGCATPISADDASARAF